MLSLSLSLARARALLCEKHKCARSRCAEPLFSFYPPFIPTEWRPASGGELGSGGDRAAARSVTHSAGGAHRRRIPRNTAARREGHREEGIFHLLPPPSTLLFLPPSPSTCHSFACTSVADYASLLSWLLSALAVLKESGPKHLTRARAHQSVHSQVRIAEVQSGE